MASIASFTSKADGDWKTEGATTWNEAGHPVAGDTVTIAHNVSLSQAEACTNLTILAAGTITGAAQTITISASFDNDGAISGNLDLTFTGTGDLDCEGTSGNIRTLTLNSAGTVTLTASTSVTTFTATAGTLAGGGYTLTLTGTACDLSAITISGNLDITNTGAVSALKLNGASGYVRTYTLNCGANTTTIAAAIQVTTFTATGGTLAGAGFTMTVSGTVFDTSAITISGNFDVTLTNTIAAVKLNGSSGYVQTLTINGSGKTVTLGAATQVTTLTITLGTFDTSGTNYALTVSGTTSITGTLTPNASTLSLGVVNIIGVFGGATNYVSTFSGLVTMNAGCTWNCSTGTMTSTCTTAPFSIYSVGTVVHNSGTIAITGVTSPVAFSMYALTGAFYNITINITGALSGPINSSGLLTITNGSENTNGYSTALANMTLNNASTFRNNNILTTISGNLTLNNTSNINTFNAGGEYSITGTTTLNDTSTFTFAANAVTQLFTNTVTVNAGCSFGSNVACTLDFNGAFTMVGASTFNSPTGAGAMTVAGNLTGTTTMTWNQNGCTTVLDGASQTISGFSDLANTHVLGNLTIQTSTTLTINGTNWIGNGQSVVLTFNMVGAITGTGAGYLWLKSTNAAQLVCTSMPTTWNSNTSFGISTHASFNLSAVSFTNVYNFYATGQAEGVQITLTGNLVIISASVIDFYSAGALYILTVAISSYSASLTSQITTFGEDSGHCSAWTATTGTFTLSASSGIIVSVGSTLGSNSNYVLDINSSFTNAGTCNLPNATGTCTMSGATWTETAAVTANSGLVTFDRAGTTTLGSAATAFYSVTISNGTTFDTSAASNYSFTSGGQTLINATGIMNCNGSTCAFNWAGGYSLNVAGTFNGGSGTHTAHLVYLNGINTLTSGNMTINDGNPGLAITAASTFDDGNGTLTFTFAAQQQIATGGIARTFYNIVVNNASCVLKQAASGAAITIANNLTITAGTFNTLDAGSVSRNLTVTGATSVSGTLTCNASTISLGSALTTTSYAVSIAATGVLTGGTGASHTYGSITVAALGTWTATTGTTYFNGSYTTNGDIMNFTATSVFTHSNGTVSVTQNYATSCYITTLLPTLTFYTFINVKWSTFFSNAATVKEVVIANTLTISGGAINTDCGGGYVRVNLTVTGLTSITGTLTCNASTISLGSGVSGATYAIVLTATGILNGGSGTHTYGNIQLNTGTWTATSGTTTLNSIQAGGAWIWCNGTFTHSNGTVVIAQLNALGLIEMYTAMTFYNLTFSATGTASCSIYTTSTPKTLTIGNNFTVTSNTFNVTAVGSQVISLTVTGATSITGTLTCTGTIIFTGSVTIAVTTGVLTATSGTTTFGANLTNNNTFTHSSGTCTFTGSGLHTVSGVVAFSTLTSVTSARVEITGGSSASTITTASGTAIIFLQYAGSGYRLYIGSTLNYNAITNNYSISYAVTLYRGTLEQNASSTALSFVINLGATLHVQSSTTFTCCTVTNNGTFDVDGTWACGGIVYPAYILDTPNMRDLSHKQDSNIQQGVKS